MILIRTQFKRPIAIRILRTATAIGCAETLGDADYPQAPVAGAIESITG
jgi:hypothetical protein